MISHKITINRTYRSSKFTKTFYFEGKPDERDKYNSMESFNSLFKKYKGDVTEVVVSECKLKPIVK